MENAESEGTSRKSSPKTGVILLIVVLLLLVGGAAFLLLSKNTTSPATTTPSSAKNASPTGANTFSSIQEALTKSMSLQCDYTDTTGTKTTSYIKGGAIRSDIVMASGSKGESSIIVKDNTMYMWTGKEGTKMTFDTDSIMAKVTPGAQKETSTQKPGDVIDSLEKYKQSCKPATVSDSLFTPPSDVAFADLSELMKPKTQTNPSGVGTAMTEEQLKKLQEQYQQQPQQ